jgi:hypothetical protein
VEIVFLAQNKYNSFKLYALVTQYLMMIAVLTIGGFLLGRFVFFKTILAGGIMATIGAILGIIIFVAGLLRIGKENNE